MEARGGEEDRLSSLQDDLLLKILSMTGESYNFVVRCSLLSKRWSSLHAFLPHLYINEWDLGPKDTASPSPSTRTSKRKRSEVEAQNQILQNLLNAICAHQGNVESLRIISSTSQFCKWWISSKSPQNLVELSVSANPSFPLPTCVFSCSNLTKLTVSGVDPPSSIPKSLSGFQCLETLNLSLNLSPRFSDVEWIESFLSNCPCLQHLNLSFNNLFGIHHGNPLKISVPSLMHLMINSTLLINVLVHAHRLLKLSVSPCCKTLASLTCTEFEGTVEGVSRARWNDQGFLKSLHLDITSASREAASFAMKAISGCHSLIKLTLIGQTLQFNELWLMLSKLPNLLFLRIYYSNIPDIEDGKFIMDDFQKIHLKEVVLKQLGTWRLASNVFKLFLEKTPFFQKLYFYAYGQKGPWLKKYMEVFTDICSTKGLKLSLTISNNFTSINACVSKEIPSAPRKRPFM